MDQAQSIRARPRTNIANPKRWYRWRLVAKTAAMKGRTPSPSMILSCRQKDGTQPSIDLGRLNPLGALSQHRGANSQRRWMLSRTRCPFSLLDQPIQGAGTPIDGPRSTW